MTMQRFSSSPLLNPNELRRYYDGGTGGRNTILDFDRVRFSTWFRWFEGDLSELYTGVANSQVNGLDYMAPADLSTKFNYFGAASRFYIDAALGDIPESAVQDYALLEMLVRHWAVTGEYCIVSQNGTERAVRPDYVFPIQPVEDSGLVLGYVFVFPISTAYNTPTGKARVVEYDALTGVAYSSIREYAAGVLGQRPGDAYRVPIDYVIWENTHDDFYSDIEGVVRELNVRMAFIQSALNSTSLSLLQADPDRISGFRGRADITPARVASAGKSGLGLIVEPPFTGEAEARYVERTGQGLAESLEYMRLLLGQLAVMSGVPDYIYGVSLNQNPAEVERVLFAGQARITRLRRALERTFERLGRPVVFPTDPFTTKRSRVDNALKAYQAGIIDIQEARAALNYPALGLSALVSLLARAVSVGS